MLSKVVTSGGCDTMSAQILRDESRQLHDGVASRPYLRCSSNDAASHDKENIGGNMRELIPNEAMLPGFAVAQSHHSPSAGIHSCAGITSRFQNRQTSTDAISSSFGTTLDSNENKPFACWLTPNSASRDKIPGCMRVAECAPDSSHAISSPPSTRPRGNCLKAAALSTGSTMPGTPLCKPSAFAFRTPQQDASSSRQWRAEGAGQGTPYSGEARRVPLRLRHVTKDLRQPQTPSKLMESTAASRAGMYTPPADKQIIRRCVPRSDIDPDSARKGRSGVQTLTYGTVLDGAEAPATDEQSRAWDVSITRSEDTRMLEGISSSLSMKSKRTRSRRSRTSLTIADERTRRKRGVHAVKGKSSTRQVRCFLQQHRGIDDRSSTPSTKAVDANVVRSPCLNLQQQEADTISNASLGAEWLAQGASEELSSEPTTRERTLSGEDPVARILDGRSMDTPTPLLSSGTEAISCRAHRPRQLSWDTRSFASKNGVDAKSRDEGFLDAAHVQEEGTCVPSGSFTRFGKGAGFSRFERGRDSAFTSPQRGLGVMQRESSRRHDTHGPKSCRQFRPIAMDQV